MTDILPLGFKDHGVAGNGIDASDRDPNGAPTFNIQTYPGLLRRLHARRPQRVPGGRRRPTS